MNDYRKPMPRIGADSAPFWAATREGRLRLPFCEACDRTHLPPGPVCPFCLSDAITWREASGHGRITTFTVVHKAWFPSFAADLPYNVVQVELAEGPRLTANLVGAAPVIGMAVEVMFEEVTPEVTLPRFKPAG